MWGRLYSSGFNFFASFEFPIRKNTNLLQFRPPYRINLIPSNRIFQTIKSPLITLLRTFYSIPMINSISVLTRHIRIFRNDRIFIDRVVDRFLMTTKELGS